MIEMKNVLHLTAIPYAQKYGGFERWLAAFGKILSTKGGVSYVSYTYSKTTIDELRKDYDNNRIVEVVQSIDQDKLFELKAFIELNKIDTVFFHFENTLKLIKPIKKMGVKTFLFLLCENYYSSLNWKNNTKELLYVTPFRIWFHTLQYSLDKIYCASEAVLNQYRHFYKLSYKKCELLYLGLPEYIEVPSKNREYKSEALIACTAFHDKIKGVDILIRATKILKDRGYRFKVIQIGGDLIGANNENTHLLNKLVKELEIEDTFFFLGIKNNVLEYLYNADIYCQPSRNEALSFTIMEAMLAKLPIVASNVGGIPEIVKDGCNGYLFEKENYTELADKLEILLKDKMKRLTMGKQSFKIIREEKFITEHSLKYVIQ